MTETSKHWLEAAKILAVNCKADIDCPECTVGKLTAKDAPFGNDKIDRYLICNNCGKYQVMTLRKPEH